MIDFHPMLLLNIVVMTAIAWILPLKVVPVMIWLERKGMAVIQDRIGPNRAEIFGVRLFGLIHTLCDVVKLMRKEDITPHQAHRFYFILAPFWSMTIALMTLVVIPFAAPAWFGNYEWRFMGADFDASVVYYMAVTGLGVFGVILAGWASNNKYSMLGGLRSTAQMISYELTLGFVLVALIMVYQTASFHGMVEGQGGLIEFFGITIALPAWGVFTQPLAFLLFVTAIFAETNRTPFDLAEGESELVAGYLTEYSSMKWALFFMAEYANMVVAGIVIATLFLGGYQVPFVDAQLMRANPEWVMFGLMALGAVKFGILGFVLIQRSRWMKHLRHAGRVQSLELPVLSVIFFSLAAITVVAMPFVPFALEYSQGLRNGLVIGAQVGALFAKASLFWWLFVHARWTLPRFRYDQLMSFGWKILLPLAILNILVTGIVMLV